MKQVKLVFFFIIFFSLFSKNSFSNETIAILDLDSLLEKTNSGKKIINQLNLINEQNLKSLKDIESQIKLNRDNIKNQKNILSDEQLKVKINELNNDIKKFKNEKNKLINNFNLEKNKKLDKFFQKIIPVIENYISKNNIKVVIDKKNVFIANKKNNITEDIVKIINENFE